MDTDFSPEDDWRKKALPLLMAAMLGPDAEKRGYLEPTLRNDSKYYQAEGTVDNIRHRISTRTTDYQTALNKCIIWTKALYAGEAININPDPTVFTFHFIGEEYAQTVSEAQRKNVKRLLKYIPRNTLANAVNRPFLKKICEKMWPDGTSAANEIRHVYGLARSIRAHGLENGRCTGLAFRKLTAHKRRKVLITPEQYLQLYEKAQPDVKKLLVFLISHGPRAAEAVLADLSEYAYGMLTFRDVKALSREVVDRRIKVYPNFAKVLDGSRAQRGTATGRVIQTINGQPMPTIRLDETGKPDKHQIKAAETFVNTGLKSLAAECRIRLESAPDVEVPLTLKVFRSSWATYDLSVFDSVSGLQQRGGWKTWHVIFDHYADEAHPEWADDIAAIWGIDLADLAPWIPRQPDRPKGFTKRRRG